MEIVEDLFSRLQGEVVDSDREDRVVWMNLSSKKFSIKLLYAALKLGGTFNLTKSVIRTLGCLLKLVSSCGGVAWERFSQLVSFREEGGLW